MMTKKESAEMRKRWMIKRRIILSIGTIIIIVGAIIMVHGIFTPPTVVPFRFILGAFLIVMGALAIPDTLKESFNDYLRKKGL